MYRDISTAVATDTERDLIHRADLAHQVRLARAAAPTGITRRPRVSGRFRHWLAAGYL